MFDVDDICQRVSLLVFANESRVARDECGNLLANMNRRIEIAASLHSSQ